MPTRKPHKPQLKENSISFKEVDSPEPNVEQIDLWERLESRTVGQSEFLFSAAPRSHLLFLHIFQKGAARLREHFLACNKQSEVALLQIKSDYESFRNVASKASFDWSGVAFAHTNDLPDNYEGLCALVAQEVSDTAIRYRPDDPTASVDFHSPHLKATYVIRLDSGVLARFYCHLGRDTVADINHYWQPREKRESSPVFESEVFSSPFELSSRVNPLDIFRQRIIAVGDQQLFAGLITRDRADEDVPEGTVAERLAQIDDYARKHPFKTVSQCVLDLFGQELGSVGEVSSQAKGVSEEFLPKKAPEEWSKRNSKENPVDFIKRVYAPWMGKDGPLTRADLQALDGTLYNALAQHIARHGEPDDLNLPTRRQRVASWVDKVTPEEISEMRRKIRAYERANGSKNR